MTTAYNNNISNDTKMPATSPNERAKKKSRDDADASDPDAMDYETDLIKPRNIFASGDASSPALDNPKQAKMTPNLNSNNNSKDPDDDFQDALDNEENETTPPNPDQPNDTEIEENPDDNTPNPYLVNLDLADDPIWHSPIVGANSLWKADPDWSLELPYTPEEINSPDYDLEDTLEYHLGLAYDYIYAGSDDDPSVASWMQVIAHAFRSHDRDEEEVPDDLKIIRRMAIRLTLSDPIDLFSSASWRTGELTMKLPAHSAWTACYHMFGAPWKNREHWFVTSAPSLLKRKSSETTHEPKQSKSVDFTTPKNPVQNKLSKTPKNPYKSSKAPATKNLDLSKPPAKPTASAVDPKLTNTTSPASIEDTAISVITNDSNTASAPPPASKPGTKHSSNSMYLSKALTSNPRHTAKVQNMKDVGRKHRTYVKLKFAKFTSDANSEQAEELSVCFKNMMDKVWSVDATVLILAWKDGASSKPLRSRSEFPKSKDGLVSYVDNLWMQKGKSAYCRALLSHDMASDSLFNDHGLQSWLNELDLSIVVDRIQAKKISNVGHLLGYHSLVANAENLADAIQNLDVMGNISVEVRSEFVKFGIKKGPSQRSSTKILQIYTSWDAASRARRALVEVYSSQAKGRFPLGVQARFIPNINDTRFIRTPSAQLAHTNSLKKHVKFMSSTGMSPSYTIIELDHFNEQLGMTLRQAIMHIFSSSKNNCALFLAVDTSFYGDCVNFAYREELENEAVTMITALPIFLFASLGRLSVWDWFTSDARHEASYYTWDMDRGIVPVDEMDVTNTKLASWEQLDDVDDNEEDPNAPMVLQPFRLLLDECGENGFNDNGTIKTHIFVDMTSPDKDPDQDSLNQLDDAASHTSSLVHVDIFSADSMETSTTPSTLTRTPDKDALLEEMADDPDMIAKFEALVLKRQAAQAAKNAAPGTDKHGSK